MPGGLLLKAEGHPRVDHRLPFEHVQVVIQGNVDVGKDLQIRLPDEIHMRHFIYFRRIADIAADEDDLDLRMGLHELSAQFDPAGAIQLNVDQKDIGLCQKLLIRQTFLRASIMLQVKLMT